MPKQVTIDLTFQPRQQEFAQCGADEVFFGGAKGGGKTEALCKIGVRRAAKGGKVLIMRRTFPELEKTVINRLQSIIPNSFSQYEVSNHRWRFPGGGVIQAGHCEKENDVYNYDGSEFDMINIDELTHFTLKQYMYLLTINRSTDPRFGDRCWMRSGSNPGKIGHAWVKRRFLTQPSGVIWRPTPSEEDPSPLTRCFIASKYTDNLILCKTNPRYVSILNALPEKERKMLRDGDWNVFEGQFFDWHPNLHEITPFAIPSHWRRYITVDWGYTAPFCALWIAIDPYGHRYVYREIYQTQLTDEKQAQMILSAIADAKEEIYMNLAPGDCWYQARGKNKWGCKIAEAWNKEGWYPVSTDQNVPGARIAGWQRCRQALELAPDGKPWTMFFKSCKNAIRTIPDLVHDENNVEDVDGDCEDHAAEAWRGFEMTRPMAAEEEKGKFVPKTDDPVSKRYWEKRHNRIQAEQGNIINTELDEHQQYVPNYSPWEQICSD